MFLEVAEKWSTIESRTKEAIQSLFPLTDGTKSLEVSAVEIKKPDISVAEQRKSLIGNTSLTAPVTVSFVLKVEGRAKDSAKIKVLDLPVITHRGTFVVQGKDYSVFHQMRLRPGVYTMRNEDTDQVSSKFNLGKGLGFRIVMSDDASVFYVVFDASRGASGGQARIPLYSLLRILGSPDAQLEARWGAQLFKINKEAGDLTRDAEQIAKMVVYKGTGNHVEDIRNYFDGTLLNEDTTKVTLGNSYAKVSAGTLLDATAKMLKVYKREDAGDDLDSLLFKEILGVEDHIFLRLTKGARQLNGPLMKMKRKLKTAEHVRDVVPSGIFTKLVETFFTTSSLASPQTEINPIEILETNHKITAMGEGGIQSEHGIPMSARNLHPSHFGFLDPVRTTESNRVGVDLRMTANTKVKDRNIYAKFLDKSGKEVWIKPTDTVGKHVGFAGQEGKSIVRVLFNGEMIEVPRSKVDYWMVNAKDMFTYTSNMVPFLHNTQGNRVTMASRMVTQALPLEHREAPLVQVADGNSTFERRVGKDHMVARAHRSGKITKLTPDEIYIDGEPVEIYNDFPLNVKTMLHMTPTVKVGDRVEKGDVIADSNFTKDGTMALGTNLRVAYVPYKGWNHEDGIVISQSASEKLTSQHMYMEELPLNADIEVDKKRYAALFPLKITPKMLAKLNDDGVVKKGITLEKGDIIIAAMAKKTMTSSDLLLQRMDKKLANPYKDVAVVWGHDREGIVTDIVHTKDSIRVLVKTVDSARVGDKLSARYGDKGTITMILPDVEMPRTKDGKSMHVLLNPAGVISRVNPGQLYETMASKIAEKTGKPYRALNFEGHDESQKVLSEMKSHGLSPEEELIDPETGKSIGNVLVGSKYILKLHKQTEGNFGARFTKGYDVNMQPSKGGEEGAKAVGLLDFYALLGHGARANLHEMAAYKSQKNEEFWDAVRLGMPLPPAKEPFAFQKFKGLLGAGGVRVSENEKGYVVSPFTDKHVKDMSRGVINSGLMLKGSMNSLQPEKGGLFDQTTTGGLVGQNWTHIELAEPIVNPMFSKVVKVLLGGKDISSMTGKEIHDELAKIEPKKRIETLNELIRKAKGTTRDKLIKELRYLSAADKLGMHPKEYVLTKFPILPPAYRPVYPAQDGGSPMVSDLNLLYRDLININNEMHQLEGFPDEHKQKLRNALTQAAGAVVGVTEPINMKSKKQELKGAITQIVGGTAKDGFFHRKLMYRPQDLTGRGTILPNPKLHVDEAGIPKDMAWELFKPFVIKRLTHTGMDPLDAAREVQDRTPAADKALLEEMKERPIMLNRAPTLHKYNVMAFRPIPIEGKSIFIPPLTIKGFNADFDGDSVSGDTWVLVRNGNGVELKQIKNVG